MKKILLISVFLNVCAVLIVGAQAAGLVLKQKQVFISCQPDEVHYASRDPYCLRVIRESFPLGSTYLIVVAPQASPEYGHVLSYPDPYIIDERDVTDLEVTWAREGISVTAYLGTTVFIPQKNFTQGR